MNVEIDPGQIDAGRGFDRSAPFGGDRARPQIIDRRPAGTQAGSHLGGLVFRIPDGAGRAAHTVAGTRYRAGPRVVLSHLPQARSGPSPARHQSCGGHVATASLDLEVAVEMLH
ncbi:MAG: hypothetical protein ACRDTH_25775 [Pseudonocardiaceae bacterium]